MSIDVSSTDYLKEQIAYLKEQLKDALKGERECRVMAFKTKSVKKKREYTELEEYYKNSAADLEKEIEELNRELEAAQ